MKQESMVFGEVDFLAQELKAAQDKANELMQKGFSGDHFLVQAYLNIADACNSEIAAIEDEMENV